jgi:uncharacterized membrane protein
MTDSVVIVAVLSALIALAEWLCRRGVFRHVGSALTVILLGALAANLGLIPTGSSPDEPVPAYDAIFGVVAPIALFWLLLSVNLRAMLKAGVPLIGLFLVGALGTMTGAIAGMSLVDGARTLGPLYNGLAGMFTGTYIGGSVNFNAIALEYGVIREPTLYTGAVVVDNIVTTLWMAVTLSMPRLLAKRWPGRRSAGASATPAAGPIIDLPAETESMTPRSLAMIVALGAGTLALAQWLSDLATTAGLYAPAILIITAVALLFAQVPAISHMRGARLLGMVGVYLFLAVIGAHCDVRALAGLGALGPTLLAFATTVVLVHGLVVFGVAWIFRMDLEGAALASQANVGGSTSALALAKSLGREDLLVPGILLGALGNALGTFLAFLVAGSV